MINQRPFSLSVFLMFSCLLGIPVVESLDAASLNSKTLNAGSLKKDLVVELEKSLSPQFSLLSADSVSEAQNETDRHPERIVSLIEEFKKNGFELEELLEDPRFELYEGISNRFIRSAERRSPNLEEYKKILGFESKRDRIQNFIEAHNQQLNKAEQEYGISMYVIAAILGVESDFGKNVGSYNPLNAYVSMYAEEYRDDFAKAQLEELLTFVKRHEIDVFELKSSYAGAMSFAQFIPYSLNQWFVGSDLYNMDNNILSVANYLAHFKRITGSIDGAVYRYNPSRHYTNAVLELAKEAETLFSAL